MGIIANIFGKGISSIEEGASKLISNFKADPTKVDELANGLQTLIEQNKQATITLMEQQYEAALKDAADARNREIQIATSDKAPLINKIATPVIGAFVTVGFFGLLGYMLKYDVPQGNRDILNVMLGSLGTAWITIVSYYFGSSSGSKDKDETIKKLSS